MADKESTKHDLPEAATCYELLERMALIRRFEEEAGRQYQRAKAGGFLHLAIGEEATIVGTTSVMRDEDYLIGTYRTHGHAIARGTDPNNVMAELFGRVDGTSGGRGGSMHIFDLESRFMGGYGIVGGNLPIAAGLGLASDYRGSDAVTVCMFGDGASNAGNFGETMNLAALWSLPVVFLVENNLYGMGTSVERHSAQTDLSKKAEGYGVPGAADRRHGRAGGARGASPSTSASPARSAGRPWSRPSPTASAATRPPTPRSTATRRRSRSGAARTRSRPSPRRCIAEGVLEDSDLEEIRARAEATVMAAVEFADDSPEPPLDTLYENLYVVSDTMGWYAVDERSPEPHRGEREADASETAQGIGRGRGRLRRAAGRSAAEPGHRRRCRDRGRARGRRRGE